MLQRLLLPILLLSILLTACEDGDNNMPSEETPPLVAIPLVTGIALLDDNGSPIGLWNDPSDKRYEGLAIFPTPSRTVTTIQVFDVDSPAISSLWVVPATCNPDSTAAQIDLSVTGIAETNEALDDVAVTSIRDDDSDLRSIRLNLEEVSAGFYRIYYRLTDNALFWNDTYIDRNLDNALYLEQMDAACQG